jgi:hypothetical protein
VFDSAFGIIFAGAGSTFFSIFFGRDCAYGIGAGETFATDFF